MEDYGALLLAVRGQDLGAIEDLAPKLCVEARAGEPSALHSVMRATNNIEFAKQAAQILRHYTAEYCSGITMPMAAAFVGEAAELVDLSDAEMRARDDIGWTVLHYAVYGRNKGAVDLLTKGYFTAMPEMGQISLIEAAEQGNVDLALV